MGSHTANIMKITYIICVFLTNIFYLLMAVLTPIYLTPGWYYWTAAFIFFGVSLGINAGKRFNIMLNT